MPTSVRRESRPTALKNGVHPDSIRRTNEPPVYHAACKDESTDPKFIELTADAFRRISCEKKNREQ